MYAGSECTLWSDFLSCLKCTVGSRVQCTVVTVIAVNVSCTVNTTIDVCTQSLLFTTVYCTKVNSAHCKILWSVHFCTLLSSEKSTVLNPVQCCRGLPYNPNLSIKLLPPIFMLVLSCWFHFFLLFSSSFFSDPVYSLPEILTPPKLEGSPIMVKIL